MIKTTSFKLDSELLKRIKIKATEKEITQSELITSYLIKGLKEDENTTFQSDISDLEKKLNVKTQNHLDNINFEIPEMLKYNPTKENKPLTEEPIILENDEGGKDIFSDVIGIVNSPIKTNSVKLKK